MEWAVVIPVKRLALAKSRLVPAGRPGAQDLALAFARDTVAAVASTPGVRWLVVVCDDMRVEAAVRALGVIVVPDVAGGLNDALEHGARQAAGMAPGVALAALPSDLPALRATELAAALAAAAGHRHAFVADAAGSGTTLLTAAPGSRLPARYGPGSAQAHAGAGVVALTGSWPGLRRDVDTVEDLLAARALGLGAATEALLVAAETRAG